jgi:TatD DNase family protein
MRWFDTHCHLDMGPLRSRPGEVMAQARAAGVETVLAVAYDHASLTSVPALKALPGVAIALGQHPWVAGEDLDRETLAGLLRAHGAIAVGEIGLDFKYHDAPGRERQLAQFTMQCELAMDLDLPVCLHVRGAVDECLATLGRFAPRLRGVVHAFSRGQAVAERFVRLGLCLGFGGAVTMDNARSAREAAAWAPPDRLMLETDAPAIAVRGIPAEAVEPKHVVEVGHALAKLRGVAPHALAATTTENARHLFSL